jgi:hypothetical protein
VRKRLSGDKVSLNARFVGDESAFLWNLPQVTNVDGRVKQKLFNPEKSIDFCF